MNNFFGLPSDIEGRKDYFNNIWKNQVLISKVSSISMETSDTFSEYQMNQTIESLKEISKEQEEATNKAIDEARARAHS